MLWAGGTAAFLIILGLIVIGFKVLPGLFGGGEDPTATPAPTATTPAAPATAPPATATPTPDAALAPTFDVLVSLDVPTETIRVGESLTVTVTVTNSGGIAVSNLRYELVGEWAPYLELTTPEPVRFEGEVPPQASNSATFELQAIQTGKAALQGHVLMDIEDRTEGPFSEVVKIIVNQ